MIHSGCGFYGDRIMITMHACNLIKSNSKVTRTSKAEELRDHWYCVERFLLPFPEALGDRSCNRLPGLMPPPRGRCTVLCRPGCLLCALDGAEPGGWRLGGRDGGGCFNTDASRLTEASQKQTHAAGMGAARKEARNIKQGLTDRLFNSRRSVRSAQV